MGCGSGVSTASDIVAAAAGASHVFSSRLFVHLWVRSAMVRLRFPAKSGLPSRNANGSRLVSAFGQRHRQDQRKASTNVSPQPAGDPTGCSRSPTLIIQPSGGRVSDGSRGGSHNDSISTLRRMLMGCIPAAPPVNVT